jgi:alpha-mannosidase
LTVKLYLYSHTHWDREWYLSQNQFQYRLIRTVDDIVDVIEADNSFETFVLDGQTSIIDDYLEIRPDRREKLAELIAEGKLVVGPWYTMPDVFLPDGESLIRNLQFGHRDCAKWGENFPNVGYIPDSFGHIEQLPQLLRGVGIDNFLFSRGLPLELRNCKGFKREFIWRAPNGDEVLAVQLPSGYFNAMFLSSPEDGDKLRNQIQGLIKEFSADTTCPELVLGAHGIDHCWLQPDIPEVLDSLPQLFPDLEIHHGSIQDYLDALKSMLNRDCLAQYQGQLRGFLNMWELHGTLSSRVDTKINNELAQMHLENLAEPLDAMAARLGKRNATPFLEKAWEKLLQNHAHDSICGCSQDRVHDDVNTRFREVIETGIDIADSALDYLNNNALRDGVPTVVVYAGLNGGNRLADFVIRLPEKPGGKACLRDDEGRDFPVQFDQVLRMKTYTTNADPVEYWECRGCVFIDDLAACEVRRLEFCAEGNPEPPKNKVAVDGCGVRNGRVALIPQANGTMELEHLAIGRVYSGLNSFVHDTDIGGGYHFEPLPRSKRRTTLDAEAKFQVVNAGPLRTSVDVTVEMKVPAKFDRETGRLKGRLTLSLTSRYTLEADSDLVKVKTTFENPASHQRIRAVFPGSMTGAKVHADASFAVHENAIDKWPAEKGQNFHPMRGFVDVADKTGGISILTRGVHEYEIVEDDAGRTGLEVTLLRSVDSTVQCSSWMTPEAQLHEELSFEYGILPHAGDWRQAGVPRHSAVFRAPSITNTHGDLPLRENVFEPFATIRYAEIKDGREVLRDTNRSSWKCIHSQRDGWKRLERDWFLDFQVPRRIVPFKINGENVCISAFKRAQDGDGEILRLWNWSDRPEAVEVVCGDSVGPEAGNVQFQACDLLERPLDGSVPMRGSGTFTLAPFQVLTMRIVDQKTASIAKG